MGFGVRVIGMLKAAIILVSLRYSIRAQPSRNNDSLSLVYSQKDKHVQVTLILFFYRGIMVLSGAGWASDPDFEKKKKLGHSELRPPVNHRKNVTLRMPYALLSA